MTDKDHPKDGLKTPTDAFAAATAVGVAMASQAMQFWFGMASGFARAGQEALDRQARERGEAAPQPVEAKVAPVSTRPDYAKKSEAPRPAAPVAATPKAEEAAAKVVALKPAAEAPRQSTDAVAAKPAVAPKSKPKATAQAPKAAAATAAGQERAKPAPKPKQAAPSASPKPAAKAAPAATAAAIMPEDFKPPRAIAKPAIPDDLKQLPGVGPKLEQLLNSLGVWTYGQVASWSAEEVAYVEDMTGLNGRIAADEWLQHAARLAAGATRH